MVRETDEQEVIRYKQTILALRFENKEMLKAIERYRRDYSSPVYMRELGRMVTLDFDDPLYPYCPFRLRQKEIDKFINQKQDGKEIQPQ